MSEITESREGRLAGVFAAALTPLDGDLEPDLEAYASHCAWLLDHGCDGIGVLGTTGEANSLSLRSRRAVIEHACTHLPPSKLLIGTGSCALADAIELTRLSWHGGARNVLMLPPFYYKPATEDGVFRYFAELIEAVGEPGLRVYLYNFPQLSGYNFPIALIERLRDAYGAVIAGAKDSSGDWDNMAAMCRELDDFDVFAGTEVFLLDILRAGGTGVISATANVTARLCQDVYADPARGDGSQARLTRVRRTIEAYPPIPALKALAGLRAAAGDWRNVLPPFLPLPEDELERLLRDLGELGFDPVSGLLAD